MYWIIDYQDTQSKVTKTINVKAPDKMSEDRVKDEVIRNRPDVGIIDYMGFTWDVPEKIDMTID